MDFLLETDRGLQGTRGTSIGKPTWKTRGASYSLHCDGQILPLKQVIHDKWFLFGGHMIRLCKSRWQISIIRCSFNLQKELRNKVPVLLYVSISICTVIHPLRVISVVKLVSDKNLFGIQAISSPWTSENFCKIWQKKRMHKLYLHGSFAVQCLPVS